MQATQYQLTTKLRRLCGSVYWSFALRIALVLVVGFGMNHWLNGAVSGQGRSLSSTSVPLLTHADAPGGATLHVPPVEQCELGSPASLVFDASDVRLGYWQPIAMPSPRIVPAGLVLSYLCDSARHQCSGVQLI
jgi:hypothetical protein